MIQSLTGSWTRNLARGTIHPHPEGWGLLYPLTPRVKKELMQLILKWYPDYEYIEIKVNKPPETFPAKIEVRVVE